MTIQVLPPLSIRPMTVDDVQPVLMVEQKNHIAPWNRANFEGEFNKPYAHLWVLTDDETDQTVFGYVVFWHIDSSIEIINIVVDEQYRGLGLAKKMLQHVIQFSLKQSAQKLILDVRKTNQAAVFLYQKVGFVISQIRKGFYSNGDDAYQMSLNLNEAKLDF